MKVKFSFIYQREIKVDDCDVINAHELYIIYNGFEMNITDENADIWVDCNNDNNYIIVNIKLIEDDINVINEKIKELNYAFNNFEQVSQSI